jgi:hypothetical protein
VPSSQRRALPPTTLRNAGQLCCCSPAQEAQRLLLLLHLPACSQTVSSWVLLLVLLVVCLSHHYQVTRAPAATLLSSSSSRGPQQVSAGRRPPRLLASSPAAWHSSWHCATLQARQSQVLLLLCVQGQLLRAQLVNPQAAAVLQASRGCSSQRSCQDPAQCIQQQQLVSFEQGAAQGQQRTNCCRLWVAPAQRVMLLMVTRRSQLRLSSSSNSSPLWAAGAISSLVGLLQDPSLISRRRNSSSRCTHQSVQLMALLLVLPLLLRRPWRRRTLIRLHH